MSMLRIKSFGACVLFAVYANCAWAEGIDSTADEMPQGEIISLSGVPSDAIVEREGKTLSLSVGDKLMSGDRIVTGKTGQVTLSVNKCQRALGPMSVVVISRGFCEAGGEVASRTVDDGSKHLEVPKPDSGDATSLVTAAGAAITLGVLVASGDDDGRGRSISQ